MSENPIELRGYAEQCLACARTALDDGSRAKWLEMAQRWFAEAKSEARLAAPVVQQQQQPQPHQQSEVTTSPTKPLTR